MNELYHYGVPGMKWGVRRYQDKNGRRTEAARARLKGVKRKRSLIKDQLGYDVDPKKLMKPDKDASKELDLKKGDKVSHVTPVDFKSLRKGQDLFVSATDYDKHLYRSMLTMQMRKKGFGKDTPIKELEFTLKEDLHSPSNSTQRKIFNDVYSKNKKLFDSDLAKYYTNDKPNSTDTYDMFIKTLDKSSDSKAKFYAEMKKRGYNAVLDQHDVTDSWMQASRPLVVMDALNSLGDMKVRDLHNSDIEHSLRKLGYI